MVEQFSLGSKFPTIIVPDDAMDSSTSMTPSDRPLLRRVSHSDTRLHIPHFLNCQDKGFQTNLPKLFENFPGFNNTASQLTNNVGNMDNANSSSTERKLSVSKPGLDRNKSAFELYSAANEEPTGLRKSSSISQYNNLSGSREEISRIGSSSILSSAFHYVTGNNNPSLASQRIPEDEEGGLKMMRFAPSALTSTSGLHANETHQIHGHNTNLPSAGLADIGSLTEQNKPKGGVFGVFNRGFFGKQVMNDRENSYRYLLAADKF